MGDYEPASQEQELWVLSVRCEVLQHVRVGGVRDFRAERLISLRQRPHIWKSRSGVVQMNDTLSRRIIPTALSRVGVFPGKDGCRVRWSRERKGGGDSRRDDQQNGDEELHEHDYRDEVLNRPAEVNVESQGGVVRWRERVGRRVVKVTETDGGSGKRSTLLEGRWNGSKGEREIRDRRSSVFFKAPWVDATHRAAPPSHCALRMHCGKFDAPQTVKNGGIPAHRSSDTEYRRAMMLTSPKSDAPRPGHHV